MNCVTRSTSANFTRSQLYQCCFLAPRAALTRDFRCLHCILLARASKKRSAASIPHVCVLGIPKNEGKQIRNIPGSDRVMLCRREKQ